MLKIVCRLRERACSKSMQRKLMVRHRAMRGLQVAVLQLLFTYYLVCVPSMYAGSSNRRITQVGFPFANTTETQKPHLIFWSLSKTRHILYTEICAVRSVSLALLAEFMYLGKDDL